MKQLKRGYQDYEAAADKVAAEFKAKAIDQSKVQQAKQEETQKVISQREQAFAITGGGKGASTQDEYDDLETGVRKGDNLSIGHLLQANGH